MTVQSCFPPMGEPKGAFGNTLASYFHQEESRTASVPWADESTFAITRLQSRVGLPGMSAPIPVEAALHLSVAIMPVPLGSYQLEVDGREIDVPYIPEFRTKSLDLQSPSSASRLRHSTMSTTMCRARAWTKSRGTIKSSRLDNYKFGSARTIWSLRS